MHRVGAFLSHGGVDVRTENRRKYEESINFEDLRKVNMASRLISMFLSFWGALNDICGIENYGTLV